MEQLVLLQPELPRASVRVKVSPQRYWPAIATPLAWVRATVAEPGACSWKT
ncbi:hypothetical protein ACFQZC_01830 [Streptacidiphilus monticola]